MLQTQGTQAVTAAPSQSLSLSASPVTIVLIAANFLVFAIMVASGVSFFHPTPQQAIAFGADFGPLTLGGQWWRLVTSMFVHFGIIHIALNMWCLWNLGVAAERLMGRFSYLLAYFASGIAGSIASVYWHPNAAGAGASGAIFGMAGTLVTFVYLKKTPSNLRTSGNMLSSLGIFIFFNLVYGQAIPGISNAAHIGGLLMGAAVGVLLPAAALEESARRTRLWIAAFVSVAILLAGAVAAKQLNAGVSELSTVQDLLKSGKNDEAIAQLQKLIAANPKLAQAQAMMASVYFSEEQMDEGIAALKKANAAEPDNTTYEFQLGSAYLSVHQPQNAMLLFQQLVSQDPDNSRAHLGLGYTFSGLLLYDQAIPEFAKAASLEPKSVNPLLALGEAQLHAAHYTDAQATYRRILDLAPNDPRGKAGLNYATSHQPH